MNSSDGIRWQEIGPRTPPNAPDPAGLLREAFAGSAELTAWLRSAAVAGQPALLIVNDSHRATQTRPALIALAERVRALGLAEVQWNAIISAGTHAFSPAERAAFEQATFDGTGIRPAAIDWNDGRDEAQHVDVGGFRLHHWLTTHRHVLPIGSVEPHYFAGLTGAHKTLTIGCMLRADIERNHAGALAAESDLLALEGNPVYDGVAAAVAAVLRQGVRVCGVNEIVADGRLLAVAVGDVLATLHALVPQAREIFLHALPAAVDVLRLDVPPPLGTMLYQADKALKNNHKAVRDGGGIVLAAECEEGVGPDAFFGLLQAADSYAAALAEVARRGYRLGDHKAVKLRHLTDPAARGVRVALVSRHIADERAATAGLRRCDTVAAALEWLRDEGVRMNTGLVVHDAGNVGALVS